MKITQQSLQREIIQYMQRSCGYREHNFFKELKNLPEAKFTEERIMYENRTLLEVCLNSVVNSLS